MIRTYAIFSYVCGEVQWSSLGRNSAAAVVGYNSEGNFFDNHPLAGFSGIGDAVSCAFNIGKGRKRQPGMPNNMPMTLPATQTVQELVRQCTQAVNRDKLAYLLPPFTPETLAAMLLPCPCTRQQASEDTAQYREFTTPGDCYITSQPMTVVLLAVGTISLTQMCCYSNGYNYCTMLLRLFTTALYAFTF